MEPSGTEKFDNETKASYVFLRTAMQKGYCSIYTFHFWYKDGEYNDCTEEYLTESVNLVLAYNLYNSIRESNRQNTSYEKLTDKEMKDFAGIAEQILQLCGHSVVLCCKNQVLRCYQLLDVVKETHTEVDAVDAEITQVIESTVSTMESKQLKFVLKWILKLFSC